MARLGYLDRLIIQLVCWACDWTVHRPAAKYIRITNISMKHMW